MVIEKRMKALIKYDNKDNAAKIMEVDVPQINNDEVLIEVKYAGICGSDPHILHQNITYKINVPIILGHEYSGIIVRVGKNVKEWNIGDRVTSETHYYYCNECIMCKTGNYHLCSKRMGYGFQANGAFTKYITANKRILHRIPENISLQEGALIEPLCVAYNAIVNNSNFNPGDSALIIGPGTIGLASLMLLKNMGATKLVIVGTELDKERLLKAKELGASDFSYSSNIEKIMSFVKETNEGYGFDLVIDSAGHADTLKMAIKTVKPLGEIIKIGWSPKPIDYSLDEIIAKSVKLIGSFSHYWIVWEKCINLLESGKINLSSLITHIKPLEEWQEAFELVEKFKGIKVMFKI